MKYIGVLVLSVALGLSCINVHIAKAQSSSLLYSVNHKKEMSSANKNELGSEQRLKYSQMQIRRIQETVSGTVTDARTDQPLVGVNILVMGTSSGTVTDADGHYSLTVPSLQDSLRFTYIGYRTRIVPIDGRTELNVSLKSTSTELSQLVVTGVGVRTEKKRLGNSVGVIKTQNLENAPIESTVNLIKGRIPSVVVTKQGGYLGSGSSIRIRGSASLSLSNQPLVYVNGIRLINGGALAIGGTGSFAIQTSRLNDIPSATILNMNVLKGASAATLYGSEANNGILEITTKSGKPGKTVLSFNTTQRLRFMPNLPSSTIYDSKADNIIHAQPIGSERLNNSYIQDYNIALSGGSDDVTYYAATMFSHGTGIVPTTDNGKFGVQSHLDITPNDMVDVSLFMAYIKSKVSSPATEGDFNSYIPGLYFENPLLITKERPYGTLFIPLKQLLREKISQNVKNILLGAQIHVNWLDGLESVLSVGTNKIINKRRSFYPIGHPSFPKGRLTQNNRSASMWTLNFNTSWETNINDNVTSRFLVGGQAYFSHAIFIEGETGDFSSENITVLRGGSTIFALDQSKVEVKNAGYFFQEQVGLWDQLYLTGGVRFDASSAFGSQLSTVVYPKVGVSYNVPVSSSELFSSIHLRGSFGTSGLQPGAFDAQRTYVPTSYGNGLKGIDPGNLGNENLAPERSKAFEFGADVGLFNENLNVSLTYFNQRTVDALLNVQSPPSEGFLNPQLTNVGEISSKGFEMKVNWSVLNDKNKTGSIGFNLSTLNQKVKDMGGAAPFTAAPNAQRSLNKIQVGYQPGAALGPVVDPDNPYTIGVPLNQFNSISQIGVNLLKDKNGNVVNKFIGNMIPTLRGAIHLNFQFGRFIANASIIGAHGAVMFNQTGLIKTQIGLTGARARIEKTLSNPSSTVEVKKEAATKWAFMDPTVYSNWYQSQDFIRFQSLTFGYSIPVKGINKFNVLLSVQNLFGLTKYNGVGTPGTTGGNIHANFNGNTDYLGLPLMRSIQLKIQLKI